MRKIGYFKSPIGVIRYDYDEQTIYQMSFHQDDFDLSVFDNIINQDLQSYFDGKNPKFDYHYDISHKTVFQNKVLKSLQGIPYGTTKNYQEIASEIGHPKAVRAVGQACKSNPIGIMIPCHRVIGKNNKLTGYSGKNYIHLKDYLLKLESNKCE